MTRLSIPTCLTWALALAAMSGCTNATSDTGGTGGAKGGSGGTSSGVGGQGTGGMQGAGGVSGTGGQQGSGGILGAGGRGSGGLSGSGGMNGGGTGGLSAAGGSTGSGGAAGAPATGFCPTDHIFCADFEEASGLPTGASLAAPDESSTTFGTAGFMVLDTAGAYAGNQSLKVTSPGSFHFRMVKVTVPQTFWVRMYIKSDQDIGQPDHNAFFEAMTDPDYHKNTGVELSEQFSCLLLNKSDTLFPTGTACGPATALAKNVWHCMVAQFDGATGNVQVFAEKTQIINAVAWAPAKAAFNTFEFGYGNFNSPGASVWYDNIAITTAPLSCP